MGEMTNWGLCRADLDECQKFLPGGRIDSF